MSQSFNKFQSFVEAVAEKKHNLGSDTLKLMLTNTQPVNTNTIKTDITEISSGNGYTAGGTQATQSSSAQSSGVYKLVLNDVTIAASGGSIGPLRWAVLYNDTAANDELIGWWEYPGGSSITLNDGESLLIDFDGSAGVLQLT